MNASVRAVNHLGAHATAAFRPRVQPRMIGKLLKLGGKAAVGYARYQARVYRRESTVALGLLGATIAAGAVYTARRRASAMRGKVVVVTGGSRGLGLAIARQFGMHGAHLVLAARKPDELQRALGYLQREGAIANSSTALTVVCDVTQPEDCANLVDRAIERYGRVDVLVNCAGIVNVAPFQDQPLSSFEQAMQVNFFGALHTVQAVLPHLQRQGSGSIVNIASVGGKIAVPHMLPYVASKFALVGLSEGLHAELSGSGVNVTTVCPGLMRTGSHGNAKFGGNSQAEYNWFSLGAMLPGASASAATAARQIYNATVDGAAEITITPQAWLGARLVGLAPGASAGIAGLMTRALLPKPNGNTVAVEGSSLKTPKLLQGWSDHLKRSHNEVGD